MSLPHNIAHETSLIESIVHGIENCFEHKIHAEKFIGSVCRLCGKLIGYSSRKDMVALLEDAHCCPASKTALSTLKESAVENGKDHFGHY